MGMDRDFERMKFRGDRHPTPLFSNVAGFDSKQNCRCLLARPSQHIDHSFILVRRVLRDDILESDFIN